MIILNFEKKSSWIENIYITIRILFGLAFLFSATLKLISLPAFESAIRNFQLLPELIVPFSSVAIPIVELLISFSIIFSIYIRYSLSSLQSILILFTIVLAAKVSEGTDISCGCFGFLEQDSIGMWSIIRNIVLLFIAEYLYTWNEVNSLGNKINLKKNDSINPLSLIMSRRRYFYFVTIGISLCLVLSLQNMVLKERLSLLTLDYKVLKSGDKVTEFKIVDSKQEYYSIPFDSNKTTILFILKTGCNPCVESMIIWKLLAKKAKENHIDCFGIVAEKHTEINISDLEKELEIKMLIPVSNSFYKDYKTLITPQTILLKGYIVVENWTGVFTADQADIAVSML